MKTIDSNLLFQDLCSRLPYNTIEVEYCGDNYGLVGISHGRCILCKKFSSITLDICPLVEDIKPYLFPLSSMTEEQKIIYGDLFYATVSTDPSYALDRINELIDWLNANHFDYRGLIPKGLAIDCTNLNIY